MAGELAVRSQADDVERQSGLLEIERQGMELLHDARINQFGASEIDDHIVVLHEAELLDLAAERDPVAEHRRATGIDLHRLVVDLRHLEEGLEK